MRRTIGIALAVLLVLVGLGGMTACRWVKLPSTSESATLPLQGATKLSAVIDQGVGELSLKGSFEPSGAVTTKFTYAPPDWKPDVSTSVVAGTASLRIAQPQSIGVNFFGYTRNSWAITLPAGVQTDLTLRLGVGSSNVDLRELDLVRLDAKTGVGDTTIDLSGTRTEDLAARIQSGVGNLTVRLPRGVGVKVNVLDNGVGNLSTGGLVSQGDSYVNAAYGGSGPKIEIDLVRGVGNVSLVTVD